MTRPPPKLTNQFKGILLEEAILFLLRRSGYRPVTAVGGDPTLASIGAGLQVRGRGAEHQIDAVADFIIRQPFSHPQRLLVEAKCYATKAVDLEVVRNALAVFKDVSEFWAAPASSSGIPRHRFHYQYAVFATSSFTSHAQRFAYAHDIHLFPLGKSPSARAIVSGVERSARALAIIASRLERQRDAVNRPTLTATAVRALAREMLRDGYSDYLYVNDSIGEAIEHLTAACRQVGAAYVAVAGGVFPIFLVPARGVRVGTLPSRLSVQVRFDSRGWYVERATDGMRLFAFDVPTQLLELYEQSGILTRRAAAHLKGDYLADLQLIALEDDMPRVISLEVDEDWLEAIRRRHS